MPRIIAYHVSTEAGLATIKPNVCDDEDRDGYLYGARVACFTTTLYKGDLPTISPYPRSYKNGEEGHRYTYEFDPEKYVRILMAKSRNDRNKQVHFLLLRKSRSVEMLVATVVRWCLRKIKPNYDEKRNWRKYFPNGEANDFAEDHVFVNVMFLHDVDVESDGMVEKRGPTFSRGRVNDANQWIKTLLEKAMNPEDENSDSDVNSLADGMARNRIND